jgi:hypothetical protein
MPEKIATEFSPPRLALSLSRRTFPIFLFLIFCLALWTYDRLPSAGSWATDKGEVAPANAHELLKKCSSLRTQPNPSSLAQRRVSDRYEPGPRNTSYLITNATIFTGIKNDDGSVQVLSNADLLMANGLIHALGKDIPRDLVDPQNLIVIKANGSWVTPGLVDINSQLGIFSSPGLRGSEDFDSKKGPVLPWLRSIEGLHTRDNEFELAMAAGVTSAQVLAGASNSIGGQAFVVKLRRTSEGSASSMVVDPPQGLNGTTQGSVLWRHMM